MKFLEKLFIVTPFKGNDIEGLESTIKSIKSSLREIKIIHLVIYFQTSKKNISKIKIKNNIYKNSYHLIAIAAEKPGIYNAINVALDKIKNNDFYMVLGSGDTIESFKNKQIPILQENIILFDYELSSLNKINLIRDKYLGMPYCHNAIIFKNNSLRYSKDYLISSDYEYFLKYLNKFKIKLENFTNYINYDFKVIFESNIGLSSNSKIRKNLENLIICFKFFGYRGIKNFIIKNLNKTINKFLKYRN